MSFKTENKCKFCSKLFDSYNPTPTFCSKECKGLYYREYVEFEKAVELYENGLNQAEVGEKLGVSQKVISSVFKRNNYKARVAAKRDQRGENNSSWKGDNATYSAFHYRVQSAKGKACMCECCGRSDGLISYDWANKTGNYQDIDDYEMLCRSCHFKKDGHKNNFANSNTKPNINQRKLIDGKL